MSTASRPAPGLAHEGIVLFAHGSRDPLWRQPIEAVQARIAAQAPTTPVACAYLEGCEPSLEQACERLRAQGVRHIRILPLFLGMGRHARHDLPTLVQSLSRQHTDTRYTLLPPIGEHPDVIALLARLAMQSFS